MTADIELLPLSEYLYGREAIDNERVVTVADAHAYAFRNVAHHTAAKDAEIAQLEKANEQLHAHGERMHEQLQKMRAAQQPAAVDDAMVEQALQAWFETDDWVALLSGIEPAASSRSRMRAALTAALAAQSGGSV